MRGEGTPPLRRGDNPGTPAPQRPPSPPPPAAPPTPPLPPPACPPQIVKKKVLDAEDGRGRFKTTSDAPLRIADRVKKAALKT